MSQDFSTTYQGRAQNCTLNVYDLETGQAQALHSFTHVIEAPMWSTY